MIENQYDSEEYVQEGDKQEKNYEDEYQPTEEEEAALKLVDKKLEESKKYRQRYDETWIENYKFFRGMQWRQERPSYRHSEVINMVFQTIQSFVPKLLDTNPRFEFLAQEPSDREFAKILNDAAASDWEKNNWFLVLTENLLDSHIYGNGFATMEYREDVDTGLGDICLESMDNLGVFPDPEALGVNKRCHYMVYAEPVSLDRIKREYPEKGKYVKADLEDFTKDDKTEIGNNYFLRFPVDETKTWRESVTSVDSALTQEMTLKKTLYIYSRETVTEQISELVQVEGLEGIAEVEEIREVTKLKWPNGRKICTAGGVVLEDGHIPYEDGKIPAAKLDNYVLPREFWSISEIEQLKGPQITFNKLYSFTLDVLTLMGNPIWVVDTDSEVDTDNLVNKPGLVVEKVPGTEVRREAGVQLQPYVLQIMDRLRDWFDGVSGSTDVSRGVQPGGVTANAAIETLQQAAETRLRLKAKNMDMFLQDLGQMYLSRTLQFRSAPQMVRITGDDGALKYFQFSIDEREDEEGNVQKVMTQIPFVYNPDKDDFEALEARELRLKGDLDVSVKTGSSLGFIKAQQKNEALSLYNAGAIDKEELLKKFEIPNYKEILDRMQKEAEAMMQAQAAAQGAPPMQ